jgi:hypothetical protein
MGFSFGNSYFKKKNRWAFVVKDFIGMEDFSQPILPPIKSARPNLSFKEISVEHVIETITIPGKPEWSTLEVTMYEIQCKKNPMFEWLKRLYNPQNGTYGQTTTPDLAILGSNLANANLGTLANSLTSGLQSTFKIPKAELTLLDGCGLALETWIYEGLWPQKIDWGDLDMSSSEVVTVDVSFRYDRAYWIDTPGVGLSQFIRNPA